MFDGGDDDDDDDDDDDNDGDEVNVGKTILYMLSVGS